MRMVSAVCVISLFTAACGSDSKPEVQRTVPSDRTSSVLTTSNEPGTGTAAPIVASDAPHACDALDAASVSALLTVIAGDDVGIASGTEFADFFTGSLSECLWEAGPSQLFVGILTGDCILSGTSSPRELAGVGARALVLDENSGCVEGKNDTNFVAFYGGPLSSDPTVIEEGWRNALRNVSL